MTIKPQLLPRDPTADPRTRRFMDMMQTILNPLISAGVFGPGGFGDQAANTFFGGPVAPPPAAPAFRAIAKADLPAVVAYTDASNAFATGNQTITSLKHQFGLTLVKSLSGTGTTITTVLNVVDPAAATTVILSFAGDLTLAGGVTATTFAGTGASLFTAAADGDTPISSKAHSATQSANLFAGLDSTGTAVYGVSPAGSVSAAFGQGFYFHPTFSGFNSQPSIQNDANGQITVYSNTDGGVRVWRISGNSAQQFWSNAFDGSNAIGFSFFNNNGPITTGALANFYTDTAALGVQLRVSEVRLWGTDSTTNEAVASAVASFADSTHATYKGRLTLNAYDSSGSARAGLRVESDGSRGGSSVPCGGSTSFAKVGGAIFDHYADAGNGTTVETDLYSDSVPASTLSANGDKVVAQYAGILVSSATATRQLRVYFGGTLIFDTGALSLSVAGDWVIDVLVIRDTSSSVRCDVKANLTGPSTGAYANYQTVTGLTLSNAQVLKVTGQAGGVGAATNDIVAKIGAVSWFPAAA